MSSHLTSNLRHDRANVSPHSDLPNRQLMPVPRNNRYGSAGVPSMVTSNCYNSELNISQSVFNHYDLTFTKVEEEDGRGGGRGGRSRGRGHGRGRGRGRGRGGRGGSTPDDKPPPLTTSTMLVRDIENREAHRLNGAKLAHDGRKNVYTSIDPGWGSAIFRAERDGVCYEVAFKLVGKVPMYKLMQYVRKESPYLPEDAVACLDIVLRTNPLRTMVYTGKSFAIAPQGRVAERLRLGQGCEAWCCFYQSFKPHDTGLYLSFDVTYTAFYTQQTVYEFAVDLFGPPGLTGMTDVKAFPLGFSASQISQLNNELRGLRVEATYQPPGSRRQPKMIKCITTRPATELEFDHQSRRITVAQYFADNVEPLKFPNLPCIDIQSGKKGHTFIPIEMAMICAAQRRRRQMPLHMHGKMIQTAARNPLLRSKDISDMFKKVNAESEKYMEAFGIQVKSAPLVVKARVLPPPTISFRDKNLDVRDPVNYDLGWSITDCTFSHINGDLDPWGVLVIADISRTDVVKFVRAMMFVAEAAGMKVKMPRIEMGHQPLVARELIALRDHINSDPENSGKKCRLIMVIKRDASSRDYNQVKLVGDTFLGVPTQCVVATHAVEPKELYCRNVLLKMNAKLGGVNWRINKDYFKALTERPYMIIGMSVSHTPAAEARGDATSIAAAVGSMDPFCGAFAGVFRLQSATADCIDEAGSMVGQLMKHFHARWGFLPKGILVYRDGCSGGQFEKVMSVEVSGIKKSCATVGAQLGIRHYNPQLSYLVMQKRHHTRFFPVEGSKVDMSGNCAPGTVVDTSIAHSVNYDFYLIAHNGIQGTSRPVRYTMLRDEHNFSPDDIQTLTYHLCFTFCRATRSVSIVPAVYYADLLAIRGRVYLSAQNSERRFDASSAQDTNIRLPAHIMEGTPIIHEDLQRILFYV